MELSQPTFIDQIERAGEHGFGLGRESGDNVGAENDVGTQPARLLAERNCIATRVPPLHALENEIVAGLQRQMEVRHQPRLVGKRIKQIEVGFDRIDRRQPQTVQVRHIPENALDQHAQPRCARQVRSIARDIDARKHDFAIAVAGEAPHLVNDIVGKAASANCRGHTE